MKKLILLLAVLAFIPALSHAQKKSAAAKPQLHCVLAEFMRSPALSNEEWAGYAHSSPEADFMKTAFAFATAHFASEREQKAAELQGLLNANPVLVNSLDICGNTALHYAAELNDMDLALLLFTYNINARAYNAEGRTPLHVARKKTYRAMAKALVEYDPELKHLMYTARE